jgi:hypothetical protein
MLQHSAQSGRHSLAERGPDFYATPPEAVHALLRVEKLPRQIWEPACGRGAIVEVLRAAGHVVHASDLYDWGYSNSRVGVDFLSETRGPRARLASSRILLTPAPRNSQRMGSSFARVW